MNLLNISSSFLQRSQWCFMMIIYFYHQATYFPSQNITCNPVHPCSPIGSTSFCSLSFRIRVMDTKNQAHEKYHSWRNWDSICFYSHKWHHNIYIINFKFIIKCYKFVKIIIKCKKKKQNVLKQIHNTKKYKYKNTFCLTCTWYRNSIYIEELYVMPIGVVKEFAVKCLITFPALIFSWDQCRLSLSRAAVDKLKLVLGQHEHLNIEHLE